MTLRRVGLIVLLLGIGVAIHIGTSIHGRGGRAPDGERRVAATDTHAIVYYRRAGASADRTPVVLLASFARSIADFNELTGALAAAGHPTLAVESRGIGGSGGGGLGAQYTLHDLAADLLPVLANEGIAASERVHVVGHAFGNRVVRSFATGHPDRVRSVTLIAAGGKVPIEPEVRATLELTVQSFVPWRWREAAVRRAFFAADSDIPDHWRGGWWLAPGLAQAAAIDATPGAEFWSGGTAPMLVLQAEEDAIAPPADSGLLLAAEYPDRVELVEVTAAGHAFLPEQPESIEAAILEFLARIDARS